MTEVDREYTQSVQHVFGTPVLSLLCHHEDDLDDQLSALVLSMEQSEPSQSHSNMGGWQSEATFHERREAPVRRLFRMIDAGIHVMAAGLIGEESQERLGKQWEVSAWANVNRRGHYNSIHYHLGGFWSGVYYVSTGGDASQCGGAIHFRSPSAAGLLARTIAAPPIISDWFAQELVIVPGPGQLLIFPSWLEHWVGTYNGSTPRVSIAFNARYVLDTTTVVPG
ncbi:TIGR02466 family protein [Luteitalea sp.]